MKIRRYGNQVSRRLLPGLLGIAACFAMAAPAFSEEGPGTSVPQPPAEKPAAAPADAAGMTIYVDPKTGAHSAQNVSDTGRSEG